MSSSKRSRAHSKGWLEEEGGEGGGSKARSSRKGLEGSSHKTKRGEGEKRSPKESNDDREGRLHGGDDSPHHGGSKGRSSRKAVEGSGSKHKRAEHERKSPRDSDDEKDVKHHGPDDSPYYTRKLPQELPRKAEGTNSSTHHRQPHAVELEKSLGKSGSRKGAAKSSKRRHEEAGNEAHDDAPAVPHKSSKRSRAGEDRQRSTATADPEEDRWAVGQPGENTLVAADNRDVEEDAAKPDIPNENRNEDLERELAMRNKGRHRDEGGRENERSRRGREQGRGERHRRGLSHKDRDFQDDKASKEELDERMKESKGKGDEERNVRPREGRGKGDDVRDEQLHDVRGRGDGDRDERSRDGKWKGDEGRDGRTKEGKLRAVDEPERVGDGKGRGTEEQSEQIRGGKGRGDDDRDERAREAKVREDDEREKRMREWREDEQEERRRAGRQRGDEGRDDKLREMVSIGDEREPGRVEKLVDDEMAGKLHADERTIRKRGSRYDGRKGDIDERRKGKLHEDGKDDDKEIAIALTGREREEQKEREKRDDTRGDWEDRQQAKFPSRGWEPVEDFPEPIEADMGRDYDPEIVRPRDYNHEEFSARENVRDRREKPPWGGLQEGHDSRVGTDGEHGRGRGPSPENGPKSWRGRRTYDEEETELSRDGGHRRRRSKEHKVDEDREVTRHRMDFEEPRGRDVDRGRDRYPNKDWDYHDEGQPRHGDAHERERAREGHFREEDEWGHGRKGPNYDWHEQSHDRLEDSRDHKRRGYRQSARDEPPSPGRRSMRRSMSPSLPMEGGHRFSRNRPPRSDGMEPSISGSSGGPRRGMGGGYPPYDRAGDQRRKRPSGGAMEDDVRSEAVENGNYMAPRRGQPHGGRPDESMSPPWRGGGPPTGGGPGFSSAGYGPEGGGWAPAPPRVSKSKGRKDERRRTAGLPAGEGEGEATGAGEFMRSEETLEEDRSGDRMQSPSQMGRTAAGGSPLLHPQMAPMPPPLGAPQPPLFRPGPDSSVGVGSQFDDGNDQVRGNRKVGPPPNRRGEPAQGMMPQGGLPGDHWRGAPPVMGGWQPMGGPPMGPDGVFPPYRGFGPVPMPNSFQNMGQPMPPPMMFGPGRGGPMDMPYGGRGFKGPGRGMGEAGDRFGGRNNRGLGPGWRGPGRGQLEAGPGPPGMLRPSPPMEGWSQPDMQRGRGEWERPMGGRGWEGMPWDGRGRGMPEHGGSGPGPGMGPPGGMFKGWDGGMGGGGWAPPGDPVRDGVERTPPMEKKQGTDMPPGVPLLEQRSGESVGIDITQRPGKSAGRGPLGRGEGGVAVEASRPSKLAIAALHSLIAQIPVSAELAGMELYKQFVAVLPPSAQIESMSNMGGEQAVASTEVDVEEREEQEGVKKREAHIAAAEVALEKLRLQAEPPVALLPTLPERVVEAALAAYRRPLTDGSKRLLKSAVGSFLLPFEPPIINSMPVFQPLQPSETKSLSLPVSTSVENRREDEVPTESDLACRMGVGTFVGFSMMGEAAENPNCEDAEVGQAGNAEETVGGGKKGNDGNEVQEDKKRRSQGPPVHGRGDARSQWAPEEEDAYQDAVDYEPAPGEDEFYAAGHADSVRAATVQQDSATELGWNVAESQEWPVGGVQMTQSEVIVGQREEGAGKETNGGSAGAVGGQWPADAEQMEQVSSVKVETQEILAERAALGAEDHPLDSHPAEDAPVAELAGGDVLDIGEDIAKGEGEVESVEKLEGQLEQDMKSLEAAAGAAGLSTGGAQWEDSSVEQWTIRAGTGLAFAENGMNTMVDRESPHEEGSKIDTVFASEVGLDLGLGAGGGESQSVVHSQSYLSADVSWSAEAVEVPIFAQGYNGGTDFPADNRADEATGREDETLESLQVLDRLGIGDQDVAEGTEAEQQVQWNGKEVNPVQEGVGKRGKKNKKEPVKPRTGSRRRGGKAAPVDETPPPPAVVEVPEVRKRVTRSSIRNMSC